MQTVATIPCMYASLDYVQTMLCTEIPSAQCVSLQRDVFGRHGYERLDKDPLPLRPERLSHTYGKTSLEIAQTRWPRLGAVGALSCLQDGRFYASWKPMHPGGAKVSSAKSGPAA
eukprot:3331770-Amphidinium_carterae.1